MVRGRRIYVDLQLAFVTECSDDKFDIEDKVCEFVDSLEWDEKKFWEITVENMEWEEEDEWS